MLTPFPWKSWGKRSRTVCTGTRFRAIFTLFYDTLFTNCDLSPLKCFELSTRIKSSNSPAGQWSRTALVSVLWNTRLTEVAKLIWSTKVQDWSVSELFKKLIKEQRASSQIVICHCHLSATHACSHDVARNTFAQLSRTHRQGFEIWWQTKHWVADYFLSAGDIFANLWWKVCRFNENLFSQTHRRQSNVIRFRFNVGDKMRTVWKGRFSVCLSDVTTACVLKRLKLRYFHPLLGCLHMNLRLYVITGCQKSTYIITLMFSPDIKKI